MESVYSEGLDGKKSRHPWNQLTSSMCILCAYCNLQLPKKVILATLGFQAPINCPTVFLAEPCHQGNEPVYWGDSCIWGNLGLCIARTQLCPNNAGITEGEVLGY